jgi:hypothetical protein
MPAKKRSPSKADKDPKIIAVKKLRDEVIALDPESEEWKEKVGKTCAGLFRCYKGNDDACLKRIHSDLEKLKKEGPKAKKGAGKARRRSKSRSKSRGRSRSRSKSKSRR